jgi:hypothetical protein
MLFLLFYYFICALTFVEYVVLIVSGAVSALLVPGCFPCTLALITRMMYCVPAAYAAH